MSQAAAARLPQVGHENTLSHWCRRAVGGKQLCVGAARSVQCEWPSRESGPRHDTVRPDAPSVLRGWADFAWGHRF